VELSGAAEILGGIGLLIPRLRRAAALGLVALLIAVFPANIYMATNPIEAGAGLLLQPILIWWVLWATKPTLTSRGGSKIQFLRDT
jgi:uncharacterized membrane protein